MITDIHAAFDHKFATIINDAIHLLRCAADGSYDEDGVKFTDAPSFICTKADLEPGELVAKLAAMALEQADGGSYGELFAPLYDGDVLEGLRHAMLEAALLLELGEVAL